LCMVFLFGTIACRMWLGCSLLNASEMALAAAKSGASAKNHGKKMAEARAAPAESLALPRCVIVGRPRATRRRHRHEPPYRHRRGRARDPRKLRRRTAQARL